MSLGNVGVIVSARTLSSRLPAKALLPLQGIPMVIFLLRRLRSTKRASLVFATTDLASDDELAELVEQEGVPVFRGSCNDLIARYSGAAAQFGFDAVARVTGDCPFVDGALVDWCLSEVSSDDDFDLATTKGSFPVGLDVEIYRSRRMTEVAERPDLSKQHREHLTLYFYHHRNAYAVRAILPPPNLPSSSRHFTVDTRADYDVANFLANSFDRLDFSIEMLVRTANA
jgi:spore coat polysaccharide biosynthesis protein SpsF